MSKFDSGKSDTAPTRLLRDKPTRKENGSGTGGGAGGVTRKIDDTAGSAGATRAIGQGEDAGFRNETGSMGGGNMGAGAAQSESINSSVPVSESGPKTQFIRPKKSPMPEAQVEPDIADQPITAWMVVIKGNGKGNARPMSYGLHRIGRGADQQIPLNFGDEGISRDTHATVEYDPAIRKFFLAKGNNLVYLNGERVGQGTEREILTGDEIRLSNDTVLRFVAFCGDEFDWDANE